MCGRYTLTTPGELIAELFGLDSDPEVEARYNVAPTQEVAAVRVDEAGGPRRFVRLRWGLVPHWAKDSSIGNKMINARSETVAEKSSFKTPLKRSRCLVLADGFYEWRKTESGKQPYHIHLTENRPFTMAGLWDRWAKGPEGVVESFTILTTTANDKVSSLHDRMPVILDGEARDVWLDRAIEDPAVLVPLLRPFDSAQIDYCPVSKDVNNVRSNTPDLVRPIEL